MTLALPSPRLTALTARIAKGRLPVRGLAPETWMALEEIEIAAMTQVLAAVIAGETEREEKDGWPR